MCACRQVRVIIMLYYIQRIIHHSKDFVARRDRARYGMNPMHDHGASLMHPADPGAPSQERAGLWHYATTQWRRLFGLNVSQLDELLFVGGEFSPAQWPTLHMLGVRTVL